MRCSHTKANGEQCGGTARPGKTLCVFHDPDTAGKLAEGRRRGGENRKQQQAVLPADTPDLPLATVDDVRSALALTFNQCRTGRLGVPVANALGQLGGMLLKALEKTDLEKQVAELMARFTAWEAKQ